MIDKNVTPRCSLSIFQDFLVQPLTLRPWGQVLGRSPPPDRSCVRVRRSIIRSCSDPIMAENRVTSDRNDRGALRLAVPELDGPTPLGH